MSRMSEIHAELSTMTTQELEREFQALKANPNKNFYDTARQEMMAIMLDHREKEEYGTYQGA
jgi:predicted secreted Zn-dependent protease